MQPRGFSISDVKEEPWLNQDNKMLLPPLQPNGSGFFDLIQGQSGQKMSFDYGGILPDEKKIWPVFTSLI